MQIQIKNQIRLALVKFRQYNSPASNQTQLILRKLIAPSNQSFDILISKILSIDLKNDYQTLIMITFLTELTAILTCNWKINKSLCNKIQGLIWSKCLNLITLQNTSKEVDIIFCLKKLQLIRCMFAFKIYTIQYNLQSYTELYALLRQLQNHSSSTIKQNFKIIFINIHKLIIEKCTEINLIDFIFNQLFDDTSKAIQNKLKHQYPYESLRILDTRILLLQQFAQKAQLNSIQIHKIAFIIVKISVIDNIYIQTLTQGLSDALIDRLITSQIVCLNNSPILSIIINHSLLNPLYNKFLNPTIPSVDYMYLQMLVNQIVSIFKNQKLLFQLMRSCDLNIYALPLVENLVGNLYGYIQKQQKNVSSVAYNAVLVQIIKRCMKNIMESLKQILDKKNSNQLLNVQIQQKIKFYSIKKSEYRSMVEDYNKKPNIFIQKIKNQKYSTYQIDQLVAFLRKSPHINAQQMVQLLGLDNEISKNLRQKFVKAFKFKGYSLQQAIRIFLSNLFLIGQTQQIDRILSQFTLHYTNLQKDQIWDKIYVFATAIILLNSDLHNPVNEKKMTQSQFIKMCSDLKSKEDILEAYKSISKNKIQNFRFINSLENINLFCFLYNLLVEKQFWSLSYIDSSLSDFQNNSYDMFTYLTYKTLQDILIGKQIQKLYKLVDTFAYKQDVYQCQILSLLQLLTSRGKTDIPITIYNLIDKKISFNSDQIDDKYISYYWLQSKIAIQYFSNIPLNTICNFIVATYRIRKYLEDDFYMRSSLKLKRLKQSLKLYKSKMKKKGSILERFANFLGQKQQSSQDQPQPIVASGDRKLVTFKKLSIQLFDNLSLNSQRLQQSIQFLSIKCQQSTKIPVNQFISTFMMLLDLVNLFNAHKKQNNNFQQRIIIQFFTSTILLNDSGLTKRLIELKKHKQSKYDLIIMISKYYFLRMVVNDYRIGIANLNILNQAIKLLEYGCLDLILEFISKIKLVKIKQSGLVIDKLNEAISKNIKQNNQLMGQSVQQIKKYLNEIQVNKKQETKDLQMNKQVNNVINIEQTKITRKEEADKGNRQQINELKEQRQQKDGEQIKLNNNEKDGEVNNEVRKEENNECENGQRLLGLEENNKMIGQQSENRQVQIGVVQQDSKQGKQLDVQLINNIRQSETIQQVGINQVQNKYEINRQQVIKQQSVNSKKVLTESQILQIQSQHIKKMLQSVDDPNNLQHLQLPIYML